jgi:hypothetical protein
MGGFVGPVAHASRVLVSASRRNSLLESLRSRGRDRSEPGWRFHARRLHYPIQMAAR